MKLLMGEDVRPFEAGDVDPGRAKGEAEAVGDAAVVRHLHQKADMRTAGTAGGLRILHELSRWPEAEHGVSLLACLVNCLLS
jgi:hypothetical protein